MEEGIHKSKPDSQRVTGTESDSWREGKEGRVKPTSLPEARVEAGAHGRILQNKKLPQGYTFISREAGESGAAPQPGIQPRDPLAHDKVCDRSFH